MDDVARPLGSSNFRVIIAGEELGCSSVSGLSSETEPSEEREEGRPLLRNVVLRRALDGSQYLWSWRQAVVDGGKSRRDVAIEHLDDAGERVINAWMLHEAWPCRWSGPNFDSMSAGVATEEVELSYLRLTWDQPPDTHTEGPDMPTVRDDPYGSFNFLVNLGGGDPGRPIAGFAEVTGLGLEIVFVEYRNGNEKPNTVRKLPALHKVGDVTLKRGVTGSDDLFAWIRSVASGTIDRRDVTITLLDEARVPVMTWMLRRALPSKWTGPALNGTASEVAIEELTITSEGIELE